MIEMKLLESPASGLHAPEVKQALDGAFLYGAEGEFEGYASLFEIADLGGDVVAAGAFARSLQTRGARGVKMLWQHNAAEPIGAWLSLIEDARGLRVRGKLNLAVGRAREVHSLMREGAVDGLSIGFRTEKSLRDRISGRRRLEKIDLWEISVVTFPMLPQARVNAVKRGPNLSDGIASRARASVFAVRRALRDAQGNLS